MESTGQGNDLIKRVVAPGYCSGCGMCAGVCGAFVRERALCMRWSPEGGYVPEFRPNYCAGCGVCLRVCPMLDSVNSADVLDPVLFPDAEGMHEDPVLGRYRALFAGYVTSPARRANSAGGGLCSWFLEELLRQGFVEQVICVRGTDNPDTLFQFAVLDSPQAIRTATRSAYYPVEISQALVDTVHAGKRFAVVGLPCVIKGVRLAAQALPKIGRHLAMTVGLACGQARSRHFAEYLCALCGGAPSTMTRAVFRVKDPERHHLDHRFECAWITNGKERGARIYQTQGMGWLWGHDCFKLGACNFCDDITSELADVCFADAVAEPYCHGNAGANFAVVRSSKALELLELGARDGDVFLETPPLAALRERLEGVELIKRRDLAHRLFLQIQGNEAPATHTRQFPRFRDNAQENRWMELRDALRKASTETYTAHRHQPGVAGLVRRAIKDVIDSHNDKYKEYGFDYRYPDFP